MNANVSPMTLVALLLWALSSLSVIAQTAERSRAHMIEHGKYRVLLGHCNNCHTAGYIAAAGKIPEERWLMGNPVGWRGKSGTTYAINLRLYMQNLSEAGWIQAAHGSIEAADAMVEPARHDRRRADGNVLVHPFPGARVSTA